LTNFLLRLPFVGGFFGKDDSNDDIEYDPRRSGSLIVSAGGPGTGKTLLLFRLALKAAFDNELPFAAEDPNGDLGIYHKAAIERLESINKRSDREDDLLDWLKDTSQVRVYSKENVAGFASLIERYRSKASKSKRVRKPVLYAFIDEGGVMRRDSEKFWNMAAAFRNAGITAYTTIHREKDISPVGRQAIRAVILFRGYEGEIEFFGQKIRAEDITKSMSDEIVYMDAQDRTLKTWNANTEWDNPPYCLVAPVQPTSVRKELVKI